MRLSHVCFLDNFKVWRMLSSRGWGEKIPRLSTLFYRKIFEHEHHCDCWRHELHQRVPISNLSDIPSFGDLAVLGNFWCKMEWSSRFIVRYLVRKLVSSMQQEVKMAILNKCISTITNRKSFDELAMRFEEPNSMNRWDSPLITIQHTDPSPFRDITDALFHQSIKPPTAANLPVLEIYFTKSHILTHSNPSVTQVICMNWTNVRIV